MSDVGMVTPRRINSTWATARVLRQVAVERRRQDMRWGEQNHKDGTGDLIYLELAENKKRQNGDNAATWTDILDEEVLEAFAESAPAKLRAELIQVAAVAVAWVEHIDRRMSNV